MEDFCDWFRCVNLLTTRLLRWLGHGLIAIAALLNLHFKSSSSMAQRLL